MTSRPSGNPAFIGAARHVDGGQAAVHSGQIHHWITRAIQSLGLALPGRSQVNLMSLITKQRGAGSSRSASVNASFETA
jgi:hypothetical protein